MIYLIVAIGFIIDIVFIVHDDTKHDAYSILYKTLASLSFVILAWYLTITVNNSLQAKLILYSLIVDLLGDFFLILRNVTKTKKDLVFVLGTLFFFIGHIFLMAMLYANNPNVLVKSLIVSVIIILIFGIYFLKKMEAKKAFKIMGSIYLFFIIYILVYCFLSYIDTRTNFDIAFMFGYFLFAISDIILMVYKFTKNPSAVLQPIYRLSYFISQVLIAMSIVNL